MSKAPPKKPEFNPTFAAAKAKEVLGRVNSDRLFKFNEKLKHNALSEKGYWEVNKNSHPLNRRSWLKWENRMINESLWIDRVNKLPTDQKFKLKKGIAHSTHAKFAVPVGIFVYFFYCWFKYKYYGVTPGQTATSMSKYARWIPRAPQFD